MKKLNEVNKKENKDNAIRSLMKKVYRQRPWNRAVTFTACVIVFVTTYMLILPAITMTVDPVCGLEEHVHTDACYETEYISVPVCPYACDALSAEDAGAGYAAETAYVQDQDLLPVCIHTHDEECYDAFGRLICTLPERQLHVHTAECWLEQFDATESVVFGDSVSGQDQDIFTDVQDDVSEAELLQPICGKEELFPHIHNMDCYDIYGNLICGLPEVIEHQHTDECFRLVPAGSHLICGMEEHIHDDSCYEQDIVEIFEDDNDMILTEAESEAQQNACENDDWVSVISPETTPVIFSENENPDEIGNTDDFGNPDEIGNPDDTVKPDSIVNPDDVVEILPDDHHPETIFGNTEEAESESPEEETDSPEIVIILDNEAESETEPVSEGTYEAETASAAEIKAEAETASAAVIEPEAETEPAAEIEPETETEDAREHETRYETISDAHKEPESEPASANEAESEYDQDSEILTMPETEPESVEEIYAETTTEIIVEVTSEPTTEVPAIKPVETVAEITSESTSEVLTESGTEYETAGESASENHSEAAIDAVAEIRTEEATSFAEETSTEMTTAVVTETSTETTTVSVTETSTEITTVAVTEISTEMTTAVVAESRTETTTESTAESSTEAATETASEISSEPTTEILSESSSENTSRTETVSEPETAVMQYRGGDYTVRLTYDQYAEIPDGAVLLAEEISPDSEEYKQYLAQAREALGLSEEAVIPKEYARFFDITITDENGEKIQPAGQVKVEILYDRPVADPAAENVNTNVVHFDEDHNAEVLEPITDEAAAADQLPSENVVTDSEAEETEKESTAAEEAGQMMPEENWAEEESRDVLPEAPEIQENADAPADAAFMTESFSVFGIIYTVDFHWDVNGRKYDYTIPGGGFASLGQMAEALGIIYSDEITADERIPASDDSANMESIINAFLADVAYVEFSSPELMWVGKAPNSTTVGELKEANGLECRYSAEITDEQITEINAQTVKEGDWALISIQPFTSEESLTIVMKNGDLFTVSVTDAQLTTKMITADGKGYLITVFYEEDAEIPEGAKLEASELLPGTEAYQQHLQAITQKLNLTGNEPEPAARFFDITIVADGKEVHPAVPVDVKIELAEKLGSDLQVFHYGDELEECTDVTERTPAAERRTDAPDEETDSSGVPETPGMTLDADGSVVQFSADSFSVYAIVWTIEKTVLASDGRNYKVTVTYGPETGIPENADLSVEEILPDEMSGSEDDGITSSAYEEYVSKTENALGIEEGTAGYIRLFDIKIVDKDNPDVKYQPAEGAAVDVRIELADSDSENLNVVHFADGAVEGEIIESDTENSEDQTMVEFQADSFSVYSIVDAPEPADHVVTGWYEANSLDQIEELGKNGFYVSWNKYYLTGELIHNVSGNSDRDGLGATLAQHNSVPEDQAAKFYFIREEGTDTFKIYVNEEGETKKYIQLTPVNGNNSRAGLTFVDEEAAGTAFTIEKNGNNNRFYISAKLPGSMNEYWWNRNTNKNGGVGAFAAYNDKTNQNTAIVTLSYFVAAETDPYKLDGKTFGIAYNNDSTSAAAMMADSGSNQNNLSACELLIRADVLNNKGNLLVAENSDIQEWTFVSVSADNYYIKTTVEGAEKYLQIKNGNVKLVDSQDDASVIQAMPGTDANSGKWHFIVGNNSLNYAGSTANIFNAVSNNTATWLNLVEKSTLTDDDFVEYSARKISASDNILSATEKDDNGDILKDEGGNPVYRTEKTQVVIYTRVWNETTKKYEFYAVDHDGSLVRVYDSGDQINWIGNQVNSALWEFTEYTNTDGTPTYFYELENTAYTGTYLAPQSDSIISSRPVGINLNGRRDGFDYSSIVAWDDPAYAYSGLKIERDEDGSLRVVTCSLDEAADFHFAVIAPPVEEADPVTTVETVDNDEFGISIKMIDFNNKITGERDSEQKSYLGPGVWSQNNAYKADTGLVSTNLTGGYPTITADTSKKGESLSGLFNNMTPANHLFIQSVYNESGYFEYDSTQNFAHYNTDGDKAGNFTVYNQLGAIGTSTQNTRVHGQFMPYNDISPEVGYAHDSQGNVITNQRNIRGDELPDTDPRKGEPLYLIPQNEADYYFGMELSAVFTQTPDGVDNWGHDIIFEFTGDDDFWFYVDGELVLDLGGVHSAMGGSVNFRTGEVIYDVNKIPQKTSLYEIFRSNYQKRGLDDSLVDNLFVTKTVNGETVHVFNDYTTHEMKMFYMERGAGASNLKMRFNLASVKPGTVELSKKLKGIDNASNKLIQYPYQIWYQTAVYKMNEDGTYALDEHNNRIIESYNTPVLLSQPTSNTNLTGKVYAVYKGSKKLIPYRQSMTIGGITYNNVFLLKAGETAVINFPENTFRYKLVECGVDTAVYEHVYINGDDSGNEIFGKPHNNTDGWEEDPESREEIVPASTSTYEGTTRSDFGITYYTTEGRPRVEYTNEVPPKVMRTLSFEKVLYDSTGKRLTDTEAAEVAAAFNFRLYLGNEFAEQENLLPADMYTYYIKGPDHDYYKWDKANQKFVSLGVNTFDAFKNLSEADQRAGTFTTSMYGAISKIPAGYTVEVRDLIVGTRYKIEEPDREIPKGYTRRDSDGYVRMDTVGGPVVYYTDEGTYGQHPEAGNTRTAEPISDTIADKTESPMIEVRNQEGWGLTAKKEWTDKDFMIHNPIYLAIYLDDGQDNPGEPIEGTVRRLNTNETEVYWFFQDLKVNGEPRTFDKFIVREVELTDPVVDENGVVTSYTGITPIAEGGSISVSGRTYGGTERTENYTVNYMTGESTGQNENIRNDTVTNSRPGIQIYKTDWNGANYLSGAVFTLKDSDGHDVGHATYTSDKNGLVTTAYLNEGTFTLNEIKMPSGYVALDAPIAITVTTTEPSSYNLTVTAGSTTYYIVLSGPEGFYTTAEATAKDMARITVKNRTVQELKAVKEGVDGNTRTPLSGVHFALYEQVKDSEGHVRPAYSPKTGYEDLVSKDDGLLEEITMGLGTGTYYLREKTAPSGYKNLSEDLCFTIGEDGTVTIQNAGYTNWLTRDTSVPGAVSYRISIENTPLGITVRKADETGKPLSGSKFTLSKKNDTGRFVNVTDYGVGEDGLVDLTDKAEMTFAGMSNGIYKLMEENAPSGYIILTKDIFFKVSDGAVTLTDEEGTSKSYSDVELRDDNTTIMVKNVSGAALPNTGGPGTGCIQIIGSLMTAGAGLLLRKKKRQ